MSTAASNQEPINYVEFPARDPDLAKAFFAAVFGWTFTDYGPDYVAFHNAGLEGGFYRADAASSTNNGATLIVFYSHNLSATQEKVEQAGGSIVKAIFSFPGGQRFHFADPNGNEFAVWTKTVS